MAEESLPCNTCHLLFPNREQLTAHYKSELHRTNLILISRKQPIITQQQMDDAKAAEARRVKEEENEKKQKHSKKKKAKKDQPISTGPLLSQIHAIPPTEKEVPAPAAPEAEEEDEDNEELHIEDCRDIPDTECLFCGQTFENADLCYAHMRDHNFYFVFPDKLADREGLMKYFGEKVGVGNCCLLCSKQFQSIKAVRHHMCGKHHCVYDFDDEVEEFYSPETALVPVTYTVDELGELHMPNGNVYGHRKYARFYKQRVPDEEQMMKGVRKAIAGPAAPPRESIAIDRDKVLQRREFFKQKCISKGQRRIATKDYNPMGDIHRGNA